MQRVLAQSPFKAGAPRLPNLSNSMAAAAASSLERMEYFMVAKYQHWGTTRWREWLVLALDGAVAFFRHTKQLKANLAICFVNVVVFFRGSRRKGVSHIHNQFFYSNHQSSCPRNHHKEFEWQGHWIGHSNQRLELFDWACTQSMCARRHNLTFEYFLIMDGRRCLGGVWMCGQRQFLPLYVVHCTRMQLRQFMLGLDLKMDELMGPATTR